MKKSPDPGDSSGTRQLLPEALPKYASYTLQTSSPSKVQRQRHAQEEEEVKKQRLERLQVEFEAMDKNGIGLITAEDIAAMIRHQHRKKNRELRELDNMIADLDKATGYVGTRTFDEKSGISGIPFGAFANLMMSEDLENQAGPQLAGEIRELRDILFEEEAIAMVVDAVHVDQKEVDLRQVRQTRIEMMLQSVVSIAILINSVTIGVGTDYPWDGLEIMEYAFTCLFTIEMLVKIYAHGCDDYFLGTEWHWNVFDFIIVVLAWVDMIIQFMANGQKVNLSLATVLRLVRLGRLTRMVRLIRVFKELSLMVDGLIAGMRTLMSAMLLLAGAVYLIAVLLTQTIGRQQHRSQDDRKAASQSEDDEDEVPFRAEIFGTVPRSMWTVFRCVTGDCVNVDGGPLMVQLSDAYGAGFVVLYCAIFLLITFGLFNLIMALFVENTLQNAKTYDAKVAAARHQERVRIARKLKELVRKFCTTGEMQVAEQNDSLVGRVASLFHLRDEKDNTKKKVDDVHDLAFEVSREEYEKLLQNPEVISLMDDLELPELDREDLFDAFDADGNGKLDIDELVQGVLKVRGDARRSDVVATQLAVRYVQHNLKTFESNVLENQKDVRKRLERLETKMNKLNNLGPKLEDMMRIMCMDLAVAEAASNNKKALSVSNRPNQLSPKPLGQSAALSPESLLLTEVKASPKQQESSAQLSEGIFSGRVDRGLSKSSGCESQVEHNSKSKQEETQDASRKIAEVWGDKETAQASREAKFKKRGSRVF